MDMKYWRRNSLFLIVFAVFLFVFLYGLEILDGHCSVTRQPLAWERRVALKLVVCACTMQFLLEQAYQVSYLIVIQGHMDQVCRAIPPKYTPYNLFVLWCVP